MGRTRGHEAVSGRQAAGHGDAGAQRCQRQRLCHLGTEGQTQRGMDLQPVLRRVRELAGVDAYEHFLGTDFTYADLGFVRLHPQYRLLGEEDHGGKQTYKSEESVPQERAYYSRVITWVSKDSMLPVQRDYYDAAGTLWKTELLEEETIDGVPTPIRMQMKDLQAKSNTELRVRDVRYDVEVPDALFDPVKLSTAASSPVWQSSLAQATHSQ